MESSVEHTHLTDSRDQCAHSTDTFQVWRIMKRCQINTLNHLTDHFRSNFHTTAECFTTVYHTMTYSIDFVKRLDTAVFIVSQHTQDELDSCIVFRHFFFKNHFLAIRLSEFQERTRQTQLLYAALCQYFVCVHIEQLVLNRRTSAI